MTSNKPVYWTFTLWAHNQSWKDVSITLTENVPKKGSKGQGTRETSVSASLSLLSSKSSPSVSSAVCSRLCVSWSPLPLCPISRRSLRSLPVASLTTPSVSAYNLHRHTLGTHLFYQSGRESNRPRKWEGSLRISTLLPSFQIHLASLNPCSVANYHLCPLLSLCSQPGGLSRSQWNTLFPPFHRSTKNPLPSSKSPSLSVQFPTTTKILTGTPVVVTLHKISEAFPARQPTATTLF